MIISLLLGNGSSRKGENWHKCVKTPILDVDLWCNLLFNSLTSISKWKMMCFECLVCSGGVHKLRWQDEVGGSPKILTFCQRLQGRQCQRRGLGGQKKPKTWQRSHWMPPYVHIANILRLVSSIMFCIKAEFKMEGHWKWAIGCQTTCSQKCALFVNFWQLWHFNMYL